MMKLQDINIRDPYILPYEGVYYLYGTRVGTPRPGAVWGDQTGFDVYTSTDLENWTEGKSLFEITDDFWGKRDAWAPEVHSYKGKFYMFASFMGTTRGTGILVSSSPDGQFVPMTNAPITPADWECLDGTLHIDPAGKPHIVFCHEWLQIKDGTVCTMALSDDLSAAISEPRTLWKATDYPFVRPVGKNKDSYVTDGPFLYRTRQGNLLCIWSTFGSEGYAELICHSDNGELSGNWQVSAEPLFRQNGGHGMIFRGSDGVLRFVMHRPNSPATMERPVILTLMDANGTLTLE